MNKNMLLRDAFGVDADFQLSASEISDLRESFLGISPYVILFTARSGSTFLTHEVMNARVLSRPDEWFNWLYVSDDVRKNGAGVVEYIKRTVHLKKSELGLFGIETNQLMLELFEDIVPLHHLFPRKSRWFLLRRRNLVAQAISNYIADSTGLFHSFQKTGDAGDRVANVSYNAEKLRSYIQNFIAQERWCMDRCASINVDPVNMFYEDIVVGPKNAVKLIANVCGVWLPEDYLAQDGGNPVRRLSNSWNAEFEARFRMENGTFLEQALHTRPPVLAPALSI